MTNNLPAPDFDETSLLGRREERRRIERALRGAWPVVSILGDGGVGKTALALQVCYDLVSVSDCPFEAVVWVTAKNAQLTSNEIVRIETAVQDSLGLFAAATAAVGGTGDSSRAVSELLEVLEAFPTLLVLDNVETVLDESFPGFLREIPPGSKVLITSRIGVKTENPYKIEALGSDDAVKLVRILARVRGVSALDGATDVELRAWTERMKGHPAYIKWFVAGVQAGRTPESLLSDNGLILDFCMSDVFDYLGDDAREALRSMLVIPGFHTMAELAYLNRFSAGQVQSVILELTTTNFVSQVRGDASGTAYELSDFAREYLRRNLKIDPALRTDLMERHRGLYQLGGGMQAAHMADPFSPTTIDTRGGGDYNAARHLRDAIDAAAQGSYDTSLQLCAEAAELAPGYHEVARVEGYVQEQAGNFGEAFESYSRAKDLAPDDAYVAYAFGQFLLSSGFDPRGAVSELQRAALLAPESLEIQRAVITAHFEVGAVRDAVDAATYAFAQADALGRGRAEAGALLLYAYNWAMPQAAVDQDWVSVAEDADVLLPHLEALGPETITPDTLDLCLHIQEVIDKGASECADDYIAQRLRKNAGLVRELRRRSDPDHLGRAIGTVQHVNSERGFAFVDAGGVRYFLHVSAMRDRRTFDYLRDGSLVAFRPGLHDRGDKPPARDAMWVG